MKPSPRLVCSLLLAALSALAITPTAAQQTVLINYGDVWKFNIPTSDPGANWRLLSFNDTSWASGPGFLGFDTATIPSPGIRTAVGTANSAPMVYLFRRTFSHIGSTTGATFKIDQFVDDGVSYYLNGNLLGSVRHIPGAWNKAAETSVGDAAEELNAISGQAAGLLFGTNVLTAEVHQVGPSNSDMVFGARLTITSGPLTSEEWRLLTFGNSSNTGNAADLADPDKDGMVNLSEYASCNDPNKPNNAWGTAAIQGSNLKLTYLRRKAALGEATISCIWSSNPNGPWSSVGVTEQILTDDGTTQSVGAQVALNGGRTKFFKIEIRRLVTQPSAPASLNGSAASASQINLTWSDTSNNESGFDLERRVSGGTFSPRATVAADITSFQDTGLDSNITYIYRVRSTNSAGDSAFTSEARITTPLAPPLTPTNLTAAAISTSQINLTWTDASTNETGFKIERRVSGGSFSQIITLPADTTSFANSGLSAGTTYIYRIRATNTAGDSDYTADARVTTSAPPPASTNIPNLNVQAAVIYSKGYPGFMDIEVYQQDGRYYVRDKVKAADYTDSRPRRYYYVDMENIGSSLEQGYPLPDRGGIYQIQCKRWGYGADQWQRPGQEAAMQWVIKPGPLGVAGELNIPASFTFDTNDWRDQHHLRIPTFAPITGKASPTYRYNADQTWDDILNHGATHTAMAVGPGGYSQAILTAGDPIDAIGEQGFKALSQQEVKNYAAQVPAFGYYFTDWEKQVGWHGTNTYWSIDLQDEQILRNYYVYLEELNRLAPARKSGDYYRALKWSNSFYEEGEATPFSQRFLDQTNNPEAWTMPAFRNFTHFDGQTRSLREQCRVYTIDWYLKENIYPDRRRCALYQVYANIFDTMNAKLITTADTTIMGFAWWGTDGDIPYRQYLRMDNGWIYYNGRIQQSAWWVMTATYISHLFGDGMHWWHDSSPNGSDRKQQPTSYGMGTFTWEPDSAGTPNPLVMADNSVPKYPREPRFNIQYSKLAEYRLKQYESFLTKSRSVVEYSLNDAATWIAGVGNERRDMLQKANDKNPICYKWEDGDLVMVFLAWPFATQPEWNVRLRIAPGVERTVTMHKQWPMLRVFSKSNPSYGL